jgi:hypothetical protein
MAEIETTEIRVHGVSGTPPESLLEIETVRQVDGDDNARFFQRSSGEQHRSTRCEAFHWGRMTSGSISKALWLLLAPFGMINLAGFTLPLQAGGEHAGVDRVLRRVAMASLRLLGLVMTLLLVTTVAFVSIDLLAWQCGGSPLCGTKRIPSVVDEQSGWPWRLVLGAAFPAATVLGLGWFSAQVDLYPPPKVATATAPSTGAKLGDARFWAPSPRTALLRCMHMTAALAVVTMLIVHLSTHEVAGLATAGGWARTALWAMFWVSVVIAGWCVVITAIGRTIRGKAVDAATNPNATPALYRALYGAAWLLLVAAVVIAAAWASRANRPRRTFPTRLAGFDWAFQLHYAGAALLVVLVSVANFALMLRSRRANRAAPKPFRTMWWGMACSVLAGFAVLLATGFTSGLAIQLSRMLGHPESLTTPKGDLELPALFHATALLWGMLLVPVSVAVGIRLGFRYCRPRMRGLAMSLPDRIRADYVIEREGVPERTVGRIDKAWRRGRLKYRLHFLPGGLGAVGAVAAVAQGVLAGFAVGPGSDPGDDWVRNHVYGTGWREDFFTFVDEGIGTWVLTGIAIGLAFVGGRAFRNPAWRRNVGVLWDLLAFWPRLTHPIVPPPYGGRTVLALTRRIETKTRGQGQGQVIISGHSQGSLICVAAALTADRDAQQRLALLTHGSQLMWAYSRLFPAYVGHSILKDLYVRTLGTRWRNLHRWSDYIGGPVLAFPASHPVDPLLPSEESPWEIIGGDDRWASVTPSTDGPWLRKIGPEYQLRDPHNANARDDHPVSPLLAHSAYYADPAYDLVVDELAEEITEANTPRTPGPGPLGNTALRPGRQKGAVHRAAKAVRTAVERRVRRSLGRR